MKNQRRKLTVLISCLASTVALSALAQDWPQWRGPNRDAKAAEFKAPRTWPKELTQKWKVTIGEGVATPALVGDKLYTFSRQEGTEIIRCLNAADGKELWQEKYETLGSSGPSQGFSGPRSSPTVTDGKVITYGVRGILTCLDAASGKVLWRKDDFAGTYPRFFTSSSPIVTDGLCIVQVGGEEKGGIVAYTLATGDQKWKWTDDGSAYASPVLLSVDGTKMLATLTPKKVVGIAVADGKLQWEVPFAVQGRGYNAATPIVDGQTVIFTGSSRGTKAVKIEKTSDGFTAKDLWSNPDKSVQFNTPALKNGLLYGLTQNNEFFCINIQNGQTAWSAPFPGSQAATSGGGGSGGGGRGGRGGGGGGSGYGSIVDAGSVLLALTPSSQLVVFEPSDKEFKQLASYKVAESPTYAYPIASGNRLFIKDKDSLILWTMD